MHNDFENEIRELLKSDSKIAAIKRYHEETGVSLSDAKAAVESLEAGGLLNPPVSSDQSELTKEIVSLLQQGEKIQAIKLYRERFPVGLRDAKEVVERIGEQNGILTSSGSGCMGVILLGIAVIAGLVNEFL